MKKLVLIVLVLVGLSVSGGFAVGSPEVGNGDTLDYSYTQFLFLDGLCANPQSANYMSYYDDIRKTMTIRVAINPNGTIVCLYLYQNSNPQLYSDVKGAIEKHMNYWSQQRGNTGPGSWYNLYGWIRFWYKGNIIKGTDFQLRIY